MVRFFCAASSATSDMMLQVGNVVVLWWCCGSGVVVLRCCVVPWGQVFDRIVPTCSLIYLPHCTAILSFPSKTVYEKS